jgi:hypothetical protein
VEGAALLECYNLGFARLAGKSLAARAATAVLTCLQAEHAYIGAGSLCSPLVSLQSAPLCSAWMRSHLDG